MRKLWFRAGHWRTRGQRVYMCSECSALYWLWNTNTGCPACEMRPKEWVELGYGIKEST